MVRFRSFRLYICFFVLDGFGSFRIYLFFRFEWFWLVSYFSITHLKITLKFKNKVKYFIDLLLKYECYSSDVYLI